MNNNSFLKRDFFETLSDKKISLEKIVFSQNPSNPNLVKRHEIRVARAIDFLMEIEEITYKMLLPIQGEIELKNKPCFEKKLKTAKSANIKFDGEFIRIAFVQDLPEQEDTTCLVWMSAISLL